MKIVAFKSVVFNFFLFIYFMFWIQFYYYLFFYLSTLNSTNILDISQYIIITWRKIKTTIEKYKNVLLWCKSIRRKERITFIKTRNSMTERILKRNNKSYVDIWYQKSKKINMKKNKLEQRKFQTENQFHRRKRRLWKFSFSFLFIWTNGFFLFPSFIEANGFSFLK